MSDTEFTHMSEAAPARRIEVFTGAGRRRAWPESVKAAIVAESEIAGALVCAGKARRRQREGDPDRPQLVDRDDAVRVIGVHDVTGVEQPRPGAPRNSNSCRSP